MPRTATAFAALAALLALSAPAAAAARRGFVLATDYVSSGTVGVVDPASRAVTPDVAIVSPDPVARWYRGLLYVVNRFGYDNVQVIDPAQGFATVRQFSVGNGANPQDIAFASPTKAYVSLLGSSDLLVVDPSTGATLGGIPLAAWADADGNPEAAHLAAVGDLLFVALGRLTNFVPADTGLVVVVDMRADTVYDADPGTPGTQAVRLAGLNPGTDFARPAPAGGTGEDVHLYIGCTGRWGVLDGGVDDIVVPASGGGTSAAIRSAGFAITEAALGGDVVDVVAGPAHPYAIVSDAAYNTELVGWDPGSGTVLDTLYAPGGYSLPSAALDDRGELYVCNSSFSAPGLFVFSAAGDTTLAGPLATGLPPIQIVFEQDSLAGPPGDPGGAGLALAPPAPNPARSATHLAVSLAGAGPARVEVLDLAGRRVRALAAGPLPAGITELDWDLRDSGGRRVAAGLYLVRVVAAGATATRRIVVL